MSLGGFFSWFAWILMFFLALAFYEKGIKLLNYGFAAPIDAITGMEGFSFKAKRSPPIPSLIKSVNHVDSTIEEQGLLLKFEQDLIVPPTRTPAAVADKVGDLGRWEEAMYPPIMSLTAAAFNDIYRMIRFSSGLLLNNPSISDYNKGIKELLPNSLYGLKSPSRIIFAFRMQLEARPCSAARLRIKLHEVFLNRIWPAISQSIEFATEHRELVFVGYDTGAALAALAAWRAINAFELARATKLIVKNANNQVKLITWDEFPAFSLATASKTPLLPRNHLKFSSEAINCELKRKIAAFSGGLDEIQYFTTLPGEVIHIKSEEYADFSKRTESFNNESPWIPAAHLSLFLKESRLRELDEARLDALAIFLARHHQHFSILHALMASKSPTHFIESLISNSLQLAAESVSKLLTTSVFPGSSISCRVNNYDQATENFQLFCSYRTSTSSPSNPITAQFLTFDAVLADDRAFKNNTPCRPFMQQVEIPIEEDTAEKKSKKKQKKKQKKDSTTTTTALQYIGPEIDTGDWSMCLFALFESKLQLSLISPFSLKDRQVLPRCSYVPFIRNSLDGDSERGKGITGCYLRTINVSQELYQVYKADPNFFYRVVDTNTMKFPKKCLNQLYHIPFKIIDQPGIVTPELLRMDLLQQISVNYLTEIVTSTLHLRTEVDLWHPRDTNSFKTLRFFGSESIPEAELRRVTNFEPDFENTLIKCLSNPAYPYRDCTDPINRWVPYACPVACSQTHGNIDFLCSKVKSCPLARYFISISSSGSVEQLSLIHHELTRRPNPHFAIFHVQARTSRSMMSSADKFNVALFRLPSREQRDD